MNGKSSDFLKNHFRKYTEIKFTLEQSPKVQRGSKRMALLVL
jgi:hypothetical protein